MFSLFSQTYVFLTGNAQKCTGGWGSAMDPKLEAYNASQIKLLD